MNDIDESLDAEFDFDNAIPNPYAKLLKKQLTIRLDESIVDYFKNQSKTVGIPYQTLINLYLKDCVENKRQLQTRWVSPD